jgi:hypothetical protein
MRKVLRIGAWTLAILVVLLAGLFAYLRSADLSVYESQIEGYLSKKIGHEVNVDGLFELRFGPVTHVVAEEVSVRNPGWQADPTILSVGHLSVSVDLWSLIDGPILIEELDIQRVRLRLERESDGNANWDNGREKAEKTTRDPFDRNLVAFRELRIQNVQFDYVDPGRPRPLNVNLAYLTLYPNVINMLDLVLRAEVNDRTLLADGQLGPWTNLIDGKDVSADLDLQLLDLRGPAIDRVIDTFGLPPFATGPYELIAKIDAEQTGNLVHLEGELGEITIFADGEFDRFINPGRARFDYNFDGPDAKYVFEVFGIKNATQAPFQVSGRFDLDGKRYGFRNTKALFATGELGFDGWIDLSQPIPDVDMTVDSSGPDLSLVGALSGVPGIPADPFAWTGRVRKNGAVWRFDEFQFQAGAIRFEVRGELDPTNPADDQIDITVSGPDISILQNMTGLQGIPPRPFDVAVRLTPDPAGIRLNDAVGVFGDNRVEVDGSLGLRDRLTGTNLSFRISGPELHNIALLTNVPYLPTGPFEFTGRALINNDRLTLQNARAAVTGIDATASGAIGLVPAGEQFDLQMTAAGPDLAGLARIDFLQKFSGESFEVSGGIGRDAREIQLKSINASVGGLRASVDGEFAIDGETADVRLGVDAPDAGILELLGGVGNLPAGAVRAAGRIEKTGTDLEFSDTEIRIGEYSVTADGTVSRSPRRNRSDLRFSLSGPELRQLGLPFDYDRLPRKTFRISGEVNGIPTGFAIENLIAKVDGNDGVAEFTVDLRGKPEITGKISSTYIDLESPVLQSPDDEEEDEDEGDADREFLFSNEPIDNSWLQAANIDIDLRTGHAILQRADVHDIHIRTRLWDGKLEVEPISFRELEGSVDAAFRLEQAGDGYALDWKLSAENMHIGFKATPEHDRLTLPPVAAIIEISGTGRSLHEILGSLNGKIDIRRGQGQIRRLMTAQFFGDIVNE